MKKLKYVLDLQHEEAKDFFLAQERYFKFDLPKYFTFDKLLQEISEKLQDEKLSNFFDGKKPELHDDVNYKLFSNKDGEYAWRLLQLIHPAIYVSLVHEITKEENWKTIKEKFEEFKKAEYIECASIPVVKSEEQKKEKEEQILSWWKKVEQKSISLSLEYSYIFHTDIVDCYGAIYTHSIPWALHTKETAKKERNNEELIGNFIDKSLRQMANGQTNGIPQGSILMDFIAEMVLGYADLKLSKKLKKLIDEDFKIIRYRDDYRIFVNNIEIGKQIIKELSLVLADLGMKISPNKTFFSDDIISSSIKEDKLFWFMNSSKNRNREKHLLIIKKLSDKYKNSETLQKELNNFYKEIFELREFDKDNIEVLISIVVDIAFKNPRTYPISISILGKLLSILDRDDEKKQFISKIETKIKKLPNTEILDLWIQRLTLKFDKDKKYQGSLSRKTTDASIEIWNSDWLNDDFKNILKDIHIIDKKEINDMDEYPSIEEIALFNSEGEYFN